LRSRHPPTLKLRTWQETFRLSRRAKSPGDYFSISPKLSRFALRRIGGEPDPPPPSSSAELRRDEKLRRDKQFRWRCYQGITFRSLKNLPVIDCGASDANHTTPEAPSATERVALAPLVSRFRCQTPGSQHHPEPCCRRSSLILPGRAAFSSSRSLHACARAASASSTASRQARMLNLKLARFPTCSLLPSRLYLLSQRSLSSILANDCGSSIAIALQLIAKFCLSGRISNCRI